MYAVVNLVCVTSTRLPVGLLSLSAQFCFGRLFKYLYACITGAVRIVRARLKDEPWFTHVVMAPCGWLLLAWTQRHVVVALDPITGEEVVVAGQIDRAGSGDGLARSVALLDQPIWLALPSVPATSTSPVSTAASAVVLAAAASTASAVAPASARAVMYFVEESSSAVRSCTLPEWMMHPPIGHISVFYLLSLCRLTLAFDGSAEPAELLAYLRSPTILSGAGGGEAVCNTFPLELWRIVVGYAAVQRRP
jgi:hypothetical protein